MVEGRCAVSCRDASLLNFYVVLIVVPQGKLSFASLECFRKNFAIVVPSLLVTSRKLAKTVLKVIKASGSVKSNSRNKK